MQFLALTWTAPDPETIRLAWPDGNAADYPASLLFERTTPERQILHNLRLTAAIAGTADPDASSLRDEINRTRGGFKTRAGRVYLGPVTWTGSAWSLQFGPHTDSTDYGLEFSPADWDDWTTDPLDLVLNAGGRLRLAAESSTAPAVYQALTPAALALLNSTTWRSF
jgi:hypothetical protein